MYAIGYRHANAVRRPSGTRISLSVGADRARPSSSPCSHEQGEEAGHGWANGMAVFVAMLT